MFLHDVVNQLHDQDGLAATGPPDDPGLAAAHHGKEQIDHLDAGLDDLGLAAAQIAHVHRHARVVAVDRRPLLGQDGPFAVDRLAHHVNDASEQLVAHGDRQRFALRNGHRVALQVQR